MATCRPSDCFVQFLKKIRVRFSIRAELLFYLKKSHTGFFSTMLLHKKEMDRHIQSPRLQALLCLM